MKYLTAVSSFRPIILDILLLGIVAMSHQQQQKASNNSRDDLVVLDRGHGTTCTITLLGATTLSWKIDDQEQLFVSRQAVMDGSRMIMGGVPVVFPQFAAWDLDRPFHGFASRLHWQLDSGPTTIGDDDVEAVFSLRDTNYTRSIWNYPFRLVYRVILRAQQLQFNLTVENTSDELTMPFQLLFHTFVKVPEVTHCEISGFENCTYRDKTRDFKEFREMRDAITISGPIDNIYENTQATEHVITNVVGGRKMRIAKRNFPDTVVWNPWRDLAKEMEDFGDDEYPGMVCVEVGRVVGYEELAPRGTYEATQTLQIF